MNLSDWMEVTSSSKINLFLYFLFVTLLQKSHMDYWNWAEDPTLRDAINKVKVWDIK